jgi:hypothetical protein
MPKKTPSKAKKAVKKKKSPVKAAPPPAQKKAITEERTIIVEKFSPDGERLLSLSFLRDGDEFCVRLEMSSGQITEFKNRSPDQLLTMVAGELEDLLS